MTKRFDRATIDHVAKLASLSLTDAEAEKLAGELGAILGYVDELAALDTSDVPPTAYVQLERAAWRADEPKPGVAHEVALAQAPRTSQGGFAVPAFVESEG
jgi:aspartyl-tRNA(Asn)/glutamyl-tRNA(Gln) amidotransferase subunit C